MFGGRPNITAVPGLTDLDQGRRDDFHADRVQIEKGVHLTQQISGFGFVVMDQRLEKLGGIRFGRDGALSRKRGWAGGDGFGPDTILRHALQFTNRAADRYSIIYLALDPAQNSYVSFRIEPVAIIRSMGNEHLMPPFPGAQSNGADTGLGGDGFDGIAGLIGIVDDCIHRSLLSRE